MEELAGRVAAITGSGSGIGAALALACADAGMDVALADVEAAKVEGVAAQVRERGRRAIAAGVDVRSADAVEAFAARTFGELGGCHLLCNNAGVLALGLVHQRSLADWEWVLGVNLWGAIHGVHAFVPRMIEQGGAGPRREHGLDRGPRARRPRTASTRPRSTPSSASPSACASTSSRTASASRCCAPAP